MDANDTSDTSEVRRTLRIPDKLDRRIGVLAAYERKSKARWIREALELVVERAEKKVTG